MVLPAWLAAMPQLPPASTLTTLPPAPPTLHSVGVWLEKTTGLPEAPLVALTV